MKKHLLTLLALAALTSATVAQVPSYVPSNGLVGWWPFNANANDQSGNGNNGTVNGATLTTDRFGNANAAYDFDGSDYITVTNSSSLQPSNYTTSAWVKLDALMTNTSVSYFLNKSCENPIGSNLTFRQWFSGLSNPVLSNGFGTDTWTSTGRKLVLGQPNSFTTSWTNVITVFNGSSVSLYVNGVFIASTNSTGSLLNNTAPMTIGTITNGASCLPQTSYTGKIDDIGIWNRALTEQEISDLYLGCANPITATITPQGSTAICSGGFVQLVASAGDSYLWSNGATTQSITVTQAGQYAVTVTNNDGCTDTSTPVTVSVNPTPSAAVTVGGATTFCTGGSVTLTAQGTGSYLWSNGATSQSITVSQGGNYSVTVTNNGCSATSGVTTVTVNPTPTASIAPQGSTTFCQGGFVVLQASGGGTYQWNTGAQSSSINVSQGGTYTVQVSQNGCTASAQQQVTVNTLPSVSLQPIAALCANANAVQLSGGSPAGGSYTVNGTPATSFDPSQTGSGTQTVVYTYTDGNGCFNTATRSVTVNAVPSVSLSGLNTAYLPTDAPVQLSGSPTGGVFNGTGVSGSTFSPATAGLGTHGVSYAVVNGSGCIGVSAICTTVDLTTGGGSGIGVDNGGSGVEIYPNPANGLYNLMLEQMEGIVTAKVYDAQGREVWANAIVANGARSQHSIDLSTHAKGIYTLQLQTTQGTITRKLVKN
jgi:hypothetical protein